MPDIEHLVIRDRTQKRVLTGLSLSVRDVMLGAQITNDIGGLRPLICTSSVICPYSSEPKSVV